MRTIERRATAALVAMTFFGATMVVSAQTSSSAQTPGNAQSSGNPQTSGAMPKPQDLEPGVNTSEPEVVSPGQAPVSSSDAGPASAAAPSSVPPGSTASVPAGATESRAAKTPPAVSGKTLSKGATKSPSGDSAKALPGGSGKAHDRLDLDTTQITGNRELPKVLYIVPWKRSDLGDLTGRPPNSLLDEVLTPVDRDVFRRENRYYDALKPDATGQAAAGPQAEGADAKH